MEIFNMETPVKLACVTAASFPAGVGEAWNRLHRQFPPGEQRRFYGISHGDKQGGIVYKAATNELFEGEAREAGFETFILRAGKYLGVTIMNWKQDETIIGKTFRQLLADDRIDNEAGYCAEVYLSENNVQCLVKMKEQPEAEGG